MIDRHTAAVVVIGLTLCTGATPQAARRSANPRTNPLVIDGRTDVTLSDIAVSNESGNCIVVRGAQRVRIENVRVGPCGGHGISILSSADIVTAGSTVHDTRRNGIDVYDSHGVEISGNEIHRGAAGVYVHQSTRVRVHHNRFLNIQGPGPRGQFVQFNRVTGPGNRIACNAGVNEGGASSPEDAINLFDSSGVPGDPIAVEYNKISGGGPSDYGGGILLGDGGGAWQTARMNILADPGQYGIGVAGGEHLEVSSNVIRARSQPFTNVGIYVWNQYKGACANISVRGNYVTWRNREGRANGGWLADNCSTVTGWADNTWDWDMQSDGGISRERESACSK